MTAREEVLRRIRAALSDSPAPAAATRDYRIQGEHAPGSAPVLELFCERVADYQATVARVDPDGIAAAVGTALAGAARIAVPPGLDTSWLPAGIEAVRDDGQLTADDLDALDGVVTGCAVGIAETGTVVLDASPDQGRRAITLVPDRHVVVVHGDRVVQTVPEALARLDPTRPLTFISGPSATSDIELNRVEGVHGPRDLHVIVVSAVAP